MPTGLCDLSMGYTAATSWEELRSVQMLWVANQSQLNSLINLLGRLEEADGWQQKDWTERESYVGLLLERW